MNSPRNDPLIAKGLQNTAYAGLALLIMMFVAIAGVISRRLEHAIVTALILSFVVIMYLWFVLNL
ncbi:MAG: hypothetical protein VKJ46_12625 [Leptolyngbyaceae bacterium]|nr:hypothetical protein [Leptolyngbyaceae bacterium]